MRVLIVGCGYVGVPLGAELVRLGHEVFGLRRNPAAENELKAAGIHPLFGDVTKPETLAKLPCDFDWVVNCVAAGGDAENYRQVYLQGTRNLIEWLSPNAAKEICLHQQHKRLCAKRRFAGQGIQPDRTDFGNFKNFARNGKSFARRVSAEKISRRDFARCRNLRAGSRTSFQTIFEKRGAIEGDGSRFLNMIHRDDLVGCIIAALKNGRADEIYNAVDDEPVSQKNFFEWLAGTLGKYPPPSVPENVAENRKRGVTNKRVSQPQVENGTRLSVQASEFSHRLQRGIVAARPRRRIACRAGCALIFHPL